MNGRAANVVVVWGLSLVLLAVFLLAGIPKLLGTEPMGIQAAAMHGFPDWIRIVVGVVEIVGAICLLIPAVSAFAALVLALMMVPAFVTQAISHEPGLWIPVAVFAALLVVAWRRDPEAARESYGRLASGEHPLLREGAIAGLIGGTGIVVWFFIIDLIAGAPFNTPSVLGHAVLSVILPGGVSTAAAVVFYTILHYLVFLAGGVLAALFVYIAAREPSIVLGFVLLFAAFEIGFYGWVALLQQSSPLGSLAWYNVLIGNLIAALAMGTYLWKRHPSLSDHFAHALDTEREREKRRSGGVGATN